MLQMSTMALTRCPALPDAFSKDRERGLAMDLEREKGATLLECEEVLSRDGRMKSTFNDTWLAALEDRLGELVEESHTGPAIELRLRERSAFQKITQSFLEHIFLNQRQEKMLRQALGKG